MTPTRIAVSAASPRARVDLVVGRLAPRLVARGAASAHVAVAAAGMVLLGGDHVRVDVDVGEGCLLEIEEVGGTVAYPSRGTAAEWTVRARLGAGAVLLWRALPFVVADGADVERRTEVVLDANARIVLRETLVLGRHGESGGRIVSELSVRDPLGPVVAERLEARGDAPEPGVLGAHRVADAVVAAGFRPPTRPGDLILEEPGAIARRFAAQTHESALDDVWRAWSGSAAEPFSAGAP